MIYFNDDMGAPASDEDAAAAPAPDMGGEDTTAEAPAEGGDAAPAAPAEGGEATEGETV